MSTSLVRNIASCALSLEDCLVELEKYGQPQVMKMSRGWYSKVDVFVTGKGVEFEVASDFTCASAKEAVNQAHGRLMKALDQIKKGES